MVPIFFWRKELVQEYLLNTLNAVVKWKENFLEALKALKEAFFLGREMNFFDKIGWVPQ